MQRKHQINVSKSQSHMYSKSVSAMQWVQMSQGHIGTLGGVGFTSPQIVLTTSSDHKHNDWL